MLIKLDSSNEIIFSQELNSSFKDILIESVLKKSKKSDILKNIDKCSSYESGFILPLTDTMKTSVIIENKEYSYLLSYHHNRSFRFIYNGKNITGLRCKDNLRYWTSIEKNLLKFYIDSCIQEFIFIKMSDT